MVSIGKEISVEDALDMVTEKLNNKEALNKFKELVKSQDGDIDSISLSKESIDLISKEDGYITDINPIVLAEFINKLGAGRQSKDDIINYGVGVKLNKQIKPSEFSLGFFFYTITIIFYNKIYNKKLKFEVNFL